MERPKRFEIAMPADRRAELERLASNLGMSSADLTRLAIVRTASLTARRTFGVHCYPICYRTR
jgi:hypothetical protein